jgi:hypothetical protein
MSLLLVGEYLVSLALRQSGALGRGWRGQSRHIARSGPNGWYRALHYAAPGAK